MRAALQQLPLLEATGKKRKLLDFVEKFTYACATNVYPNSFGLKEIIIQNKYCDPNKLKVLANGSSNGIDTDHFSASHFSAAGNLEMRKSLSIEPADFVFIFVGRLVKDKGINELIGALCILADEFPQVKLLLVGDYEADLDPLSAETINAINSHPAIKSTGFQYDVRPYLALSDALVFPSYREGFPNGVLQAGAMGLPCIVSDINGCNEIIKNGQNGRIIPAKDQQALLNAMRELLSDTELVAKMKQNARPMIVDRFSQRVVWDAILEEYRKFGNPDRHYVS
ncbi:MAG: glycosyltransferase family 1 protein [Flavobacterium sp.]|nr:MAG: glycosyltransferase family 1 protein [Flavobacterium sp.]